MEEEILYQQILQDLTQNHQVISFANNDYVCYGHIHDLNLPSFPVRINGCVIVLCTNGSASAEINEQTFTIQEHGLAVNLPENVFQIKDTSPDFDGFYIITSSSFLYKYLKIRQNINSYIYIHHMVNIPLNREEFDIYSHYITLLLEILATKENNLKISIIDGLFLSLANYVISIIENHINVGTTVTTVPQKHQEAIFSKFIEILSENYKQEHSVQFYADKLNITSKHLTKLLKGYTQKGASEWITNYIIQEAKMLLKYSDLSIQEIAYKLNFPSQTFFGKYFKKYTGVTPGSFRSEYASKTKKAQM